MDRDPWLDKWMPLLKQSSASGFILELGCGKGWDTTELLGAGSKVIATDHIKRNLTATTLIAPYADMTQLDHSQPLPFVSHSISVIVASLTVHYFAWTLTLQIASELQRCLKSDGILLARFNSTNDVYYGASSGLEIEPNFYQTATKTKRFFDNAAVRAFLQGWDIRFLEENVIHRFGKPKSVWEVMAVSHAKEGAL